MANRLLALVSLLLLAVGAACNGGGNSSAVEGKLVDFNNKPVAGVKIIAAQVQPLKGYEKCEAITNKDGSFRLTGLFPSSAYVLNPWSDKWTCKAEFKLKSAPRGETAVLPEPMKIAQAYAKHGGSLMLPYTGKPRFMLSVDRVVTDAITGLEWVVGPDQNTSYARAEQWVAACQVAGGGWRMPTKSELKALYQQGLGERNIDTAFKTTGWWVWAEPRDVSSAWLFSFDFGLVHWCNRENAYNYRVFGVRSPPR